MEAEPLEGIPTLCVGTRDRRERDRKGDTADCNFASVQIIVGAQHCCAPTCVLHLPEKRCKLTTLFTLMNLLIN
jgi:hypothetical protein